MAERMTLPANVTDTMGEKNASPLRFISITIGGIFVAEIIAMMVIYYLKPEPYWLETLLDALIMTAIVFPVIYYFSVRTLLLQIAERKRSESLLSKVLENLPVGVWITDQNGKVVHGNLASQQIWAGARYVEIEQYGEYKGWWLDSGKLIQPEEWAAARAVRHGQTSLNEEIEIECFDGTHKIMLNSATPILDEQKAIQGAIVVNEDITQRKHAEQAIKESEALFRAVFENLPLGVWLADGEGNITYGNPAGQQIWAGARYVGVEQFGEYKAWWVNTGKPVEAEEWGVARAVQKGETSLNEELKIECFDGTHKFILNSAIPIWGDRQQVLGAFVVNQDITRRRKYEQELIHTNELLERYFSSIDTHIAYMDRDFNFIRVNDAYARAAGHPVEFFTGKNHFDLYPHEENQAIFQRVVDTGEPFVVFEKPFEYAEFPERGVTYWDWSLQPVRRADNAIEGVVLSLVDVTERKRAEIQLERQNEDLRALSVAEHTAREMAEGLVRSAVAASSSLQLEEVLDTILEQIRRAVPFQMADIAMVEGKMIRVVGYLDFNGNHGAKQAMEKIYFLDDFPLWLKVYSTHQPIFIEDTRDSPDWQVVPGMEWVHSFAVAPLITKDQVMGFINLTSDQAGFFNQEMVDRLVAFAAPAAVAIHNARLYMAETHARKVAETLSAAVQALTRTLDLDRVLDTLLEHITAITQSDTTGIALVEGETRLAARAAHGYERWTNLDQILSISVEATSHPLLGTLISTHKSVLVPDTTTYPDWQVIPGLEPIRNWLVVPLVAGDKVIGVVGLGKTEPDYFTQEHIQWAEALVGQAAMAIQNAWLFEQVRASHERLQSLSRRLVEVQESERRYIARELHDESGQALTALMFGLRLMEQEVDHPENLLVRLAELKLLADEVLEDLHRLAMDLRPASLDHLGLVTALEQLVKVICERYNICVRFKTVGISEETRLPDDVETALYRIVQEALTNAVRHANASNIDVILELRDEKSIVVVEDDGIGFETQEIHKSGHLGLLGMQERAQMAGGTLQIESRPGGGTTIVAEVPYVDTYLDRR
jgi:PAS domain S-box-containing protein